MTLRNPKRRHMKRPGQHATTRRRRRVGPVLRGVSPKARERSEPFRRGEQSRSELRGAKAPRDLRQPERPLRRMHVNLMKQSTDAALRALLARRQFVRMAGAGTAIVALGGVQWMFSDDLTRAARAETRPDGRPR